MQVMKLFVLLNLNHRGTSTSRVGFHKSWAHGVKQKAQLHAKFGLND
jgi:hypothetical protein